MTVAFKIVFPIDTLRPMSEQPKHIIVVDDEKPLARALELKLTHEGFTAQQFGDGEQLLKFLEGKGKADLILLDLMMPICDGFTVLERMKEKGIKIPVMVLTNLSQAEDQKRVRDLGVKDFVVKSDTPIIEIVNKVKTFLKK